MPNRADNQPQRTASHSRYAATLALLLMGLFYTACADCQGCQPPQEEPPPAPETKDQPVAEQAPTPPAEPREQPKPTPPTQEAPCVLDVPDVVAEVNGEPISRKTMEDALHYTVADRDDVPCTHWKTSHQRALDSVIERKIYTMEAKKRGIDINDVQQKTENMVTDDMDPKYASDVINSLERSIGREFLGMAIYADEIQKRSPISDQQLRDYYEKNKAGFTIPEKVNFRHIRCFSDQSDTPEGEQRDLEKCQALKARLDAGEDFCSVAKDSDEPVFNELCGSQGFMPLSGRGPMGEYYLRVKAMKDGETIGPIKAGRGYAIVNRIESRPAQERSFEEVKDGLRDAMSMMNGEENESMPDRDTFLQEIKDSYTVKRYYFPMEQHQ